MSINNCYNCGGSIPELKIEKGKFSFVCPKCLCATNYTDDLSQAQEDWNEGFVYLKKEIKQYKQYTFKED